MEFSSIAPGGRTVTVETGVGVRGLKFAPKTQVGSIDSYKSKRKVLAGE